jgi:hypothetical protein
MHSVCHKNTTDNCTARAAIGSGVRCDNVAAQTRSIDADAGSYEAELLGKTWDAAAYKHISYDTRTSQAEAGIPADRQRLYNQ